MNGYEVAAHILAGGPDPTEDDIADEGICAEEDIEIVSLGEDDGDDAATMEGAVDAFGAKAQDSRCMLCNRCEIIFVRKACDGGQQYNGGTSPVDLPAAKLQLPAVTGYSHICLVPIERVFQQCFVSGRDERLGRLDPHIAGPRQSRAHVA